MFWTVLLGACGLFFLFELFRSDSPKQFKPGKFYYTKKWLFRVMLWLNSHQQKSKKKNASQLDRKKRGYGVSIQDHAVLESCQSLEDDPMAIDTVYFNGFDRNGTGLALRLARKPNREGELWVWLNLSGVGFFQHPIMPDTCVYNMTSDGYQALGLKLQVIEPMKMWKVTYNGLLRKGMCNNVTEKPEEFVNVKMSFKWKAFNDPFNFDVDLDKNLLADAIAREKWTKEFWAKLRGKHQTHYEQAGQLSGVIEIEGQEPRNVLLHSFRDHTFGIRNWEMFHRYAIHFIWMEEIGVMAMVAVLWMPDYISLLHSGYLLYASGDTLPVTHIDLDIETVTKDHIPPEQYSFSFIAGGKTYNVDLVAMVTPEAYHYRTRTSRVLERFCTYTVNGQSARGLTEYHYRNPEGPTMTGDIPSTVSLLHEPVNIEEYKEKITLTFEESMCLSSALVGGKGSQLAMLTSIQKQVDAIVPRGFCLTLAAFEQQILKSSEICSSIGNIENAIRNGNLTGMQALCADTVELLAGCKMAQPIELELTSQLENVFGKQFEVTRLAVRSSAAGEDGYEASSAGQMETFLGVCGLNNILDTVRKCWASAYTYHAVEYRRQHGQAIRTSMGVVIQEMVPSYISGVLFTHDPVSGNPNKIVIDASFGLGESVVSGKTTPDSIFVQRYFDDTLEILGRNIGSKSTEVIMCENGGTKEVDIKTGASSKVCLSDKQVLQLCNIAIKVENYFGSGRDIEWAIQNDEIYLLQARPITSTDQETDDDLIHEFDTPLPTNFECLTLGNIGEMIPGVVTPLTLSVFGYAVDKATMSAGVDSTGGSYVYSTSKTVPAYCGRLFINLTAIAQCSSNSIVFNKSALEMNLLGEILEDHELSKIIAYGHQKTSVPSKLYDLFSFIRINGGKSKRADSWSKRMNTYTIGDNCTTARDMYLEIDSKLPDYNEIWETTVQVSAQSGTFGGIVMGIVSGGKEAWTSENYSDVALLLSQCTDVYSAEVPTAMKELARLIVTMEIGDKFLSFTEEQAVEYITSNSCPSEIRTKYSEFMSRHGHRCVREAELIEQSWRAEPVKLIKVLKSIIKSKAYDENKMTVTSLDETISQLKSPVSGFGKMILKKGLVDKARTAVGRREFGKSVAVELSDIFKQAYWKLAELMFIEGRLPDKELMFYLTHSEIGQLLCNRSAALVTKAMRRRKLLPVQDKMEFPRLCSGIPQPLCKKDHSADRDATFTVKGMPVSCGTVKGYVKVVKSLDDADQIKRGDILIVSYTDVGWSPYFPLIAGLVTEMGGLLSHGAVVAREYGLPCIVNVHNVTNLFSTGDYILLDGTAGAIHRLQHTGSEDEN
ncbi:hypothetical protein ACF0H5_017972 [Mactra antiquata]